MRYERKWEIDERRFDRKRCVYEKGNITKATISTKYKLTDINCNVILANGFSIVLQLTSQHPPPIATIPKLTGIKCDISISRTRKSARRAVILIIGIAATKYLIQAASANHSNPLNAPAVRDKTLTQAKNAAIFIRVPGCPIAITAKPSDHEVSLIRRIKDSSE